MKMERNLYFIFGCITLLIIIPWVLNFWDNSISINPDKWGVFGDYIGGTLATVASIFSLFALLQTLKSQQKQIEFMQKQNLEKDTQHSIDRLEKDLVNTLNRYPILIQRRNGVEQQISGYDTLFNLTINYQQIIPRKDSICLTETYSTSDPKVLMFEMFGLAAGELNQIRKHCIFLEEISTNNILSSYYHRKYKIPYQRLLDMGYLEKNWE